MCLVLCIVTQCDIVNFFMRLKGLCMLYLLICTSIINVLYFLNLILFYLTSAVEMFI